MFDRLTGSSEEKLEEGLEKTKNSLFDKLDRLVRGKDEVDAEVLDQLEEVLITSDVGVDTTLAIIDRIEARVAEEQYTSTSELNQIMRDEIVNLLSEQDATQPTTFSDELEETPHVIMIVGVNGVGKTTTIGKLAHKYKQAGRSVMLGAADTYRAAAIEQLEIWAERAEVPLIKQKQGADPAAVAYDTLESALSKDVDVVIIDTAGRLHTRGGLMDELAKTKRVMSRLVDGAPHEVLLVLDASTGQNAIRQAEEFTESVDVTGLVLTKLDGTAKGGIVIGVSHEFNVPVKYIGVGEKLEDLEIFDRQAFVNTLFSDSSLQ